MIGPVYVEAVGLAAPGLPGWSRSLEVLDGSRAWVEESEVRFVPTLLPANERRRATDTIRRAFQAGEDVRERSVLDFSQLATVFATSDADMGIIHRCLLYTSPSPRDLSTSRMPSSA